MGTPFFLSVIGAARDHVFQGFFVVPRYHPLLLHCLVDALLTKQSGPGGKQYMRFCRILWEKIQVAWRFKPAAGLVSNGGAWLGVFAGRGEEQGEECGAAWREDGEGGWAFYCGGTEALDGDPWVGLVPWVPGDSNRDGGAGAEIARASDDFEPGLEAVKGAEQVPPDWEQKCQDRFAWLGGVTKVCDELFRGQVRGEVNELGAAEIEEFVAGGLFLHPAVEGVLTCVLQAEEGACICS